MITRRPIIGGRKQASGDATLLQQKKDRRRPFWSEIVRQTIEEGKMGLHTTVNSLQGLLGEITQDLQKAGKGNKSAAQRVRTRSIEFSKVAKTYRKESVLAEKQQVAQLHKKKTPAKKKTPKTPVRKKGAGKR